MAEQEQGNIRQEYNNATTGLNMDQTPNQIEKGKLTYALNANLENFDGNSVNYQNEQGNELCVTFPSGFVLIGSHFIQEKYKHIFFITNPETGDSQIGCMDNNDCIYRVIVNSPCLNFNINHPIHKTAHKITNCSTEIYWTDGLNPRRYLDIDNIPKILKSGSPLCSPEYTDDVDCNQLKLQPNFKIPSLEVKTVGSTGSLTAGTYQFAIQYSDALGNPYTSYYSITNPTPIADPFLTTVNFNYNVGKSIVLNINNLEDTGLYKYFNLAVIKTVNAISSVELVGTYYIDSVQKEITYTGQNQTQIRLSINDIFEKFPYYDIAQDLTTAQDVLIWDNLTSIDRINYQSIANQISLKWETWRIPATENYADEINATNLRGYLRDEVYAFEIVFLLKNGKQTDGFHIPGRIKSTSETVLPDIPETNNDFIGDPDYEQGGVGFSPYWKIYNTASVTGFSAGYSSAPTYKGPYQYGEFSYWESTDTYPCNEDVWGDLSGKPIRHHKFPDINISPSFESKLFTSASGMVMGNDAVFPIGVQLDVQQLKSLIGASSLPQEQKDDIVGFKIVRGDRGTNKSIVAKGMLRNVNTYTRQEQTFYYPNYPYNDLSSDVFLNSANNAYSQLCEGYDVIIQSLGTNPYAEVEYTDCNNNKQTKIRYNSTGTYQLCSIGKPIIIGPATGLVGVSTYDVWNIQVCNPSCFLCRGGRVQYNDIYEGLKTAWIDGWPLYPVVTVLVVPGTVPIQVEGPGDVCFFFQKTITAKNCKGETPQPGFTDKYRQIFNSPETSFGQPFLGNILKLESVIFGKGKAHFVEVKNNARYKLLTEEAQRDALDSAARLGGLTDPFNAGAMFSAYQSYLTIYINGITRKNYAYSYNSIADYNYSVGVPDNQGVKQRTLDIKRYLIPGMINVNDTYSINNYQRETSVYLRTDLNKTALPFPDSSPNMLFGTTPSLTDKSRSTISGASNCSNPAKEFDISVVSYYASIKNVFPNQYGQIYSYETIDTGYQELLDSSSTTATVFGGDTFISRFAYKTKLPFFTDSRVGAPDDSDVFYDEIGNIAYPKYWHSARSILKDYTINNTGETTPPYMSNIISYKAHNFDCPNSQTLAPNQLPASNPNRTFYDGYFYMFAYGIPNFYCESSYNLDLRQAFNSKEGEFWPHVTTGIPDDWVQETFVPIAQDNSYYYNVTFSKQNKENFFSHLPIDWDKPCYTFYPFRAIYSEPQNIDADNRINNWLIYKALSYYDFPQNYGKLISLDGIQNKAVLARFDNKTLLYNNLLTIDTSNPQAAYVGNPVMFKQGPPIDFAETDLGYVGSQNKMLLKIPQGQVTVDAKRGQVFLITGTQAVDLSAFGSGLNRFFTDHLAFEIIRHFPDVPTDNHFNGIGLHGVYDSKYDRVIITKLDYVPKRNDIKYDAVTNEFYIETIVNQQPTTTTSTTTGAPLSTTTTTTVVIPLTSTTTTTMRPIIERQVVNLSDEDYFCNRGWTLSFNFNTKSWVSFHSYLPNWYIGENNFFYSGLNDCCSDFDVLAAVPGPIPTTTTTSSTSTTSTTSTSTSTTTSTSTSTSTTTSTSSTTTTTTTGCPKAGGLIEEAFFTGYEVTTPPSYSIDSTATQFAACSAVSYLNSLPVPYPNVIPTYIIVYYQGLFLGSYVYTSNDPQNCTCAPNGWYFTGESQATNRVFRVENCSIVEIVNCIPPTTTTTSSTSSTTTTTTTQCLCVQDASVLVTTGGTINYLDCYGNLQTATVSNGPAVIVGCLRRGSLVPGTAVYTIEGYGACCTPPPTTTSTTSSTSSTTSTSTSTTSTSTSTSTSTTSTSTSSTTTTTTTVCPCGPIQVTIYADDIANATGNDNPGQNGVVFFQYYDCSNTLQLVQFTNSGVYNFCGCSFNQPYHYKNNAQQTGSSIALPGGEGCSF